jgi:CYTH domain-containing protein
MMATEIERKFLVTGDAWRGIASAGTLYRQGYLSIDVERTVRVRVAGERASLTIKGPSVGARRNEFEYSIPRDEALQLLEELCLRPIIEKTRHRLSRDGLTWEIDEFGGENRGLVVAEVELTDESQVVAPPDWIGDEVTGDPRYYNANLVRHPFSRW